jgi:porin
MRLRLIDNHVSIAKFSTAKIAFLTDRESRMKVRQLYIHLTAALLAMLFGRFCRATPPIFAPSDPSQEQQSDTSGAHAPGFLEGVSRSSYLLGDMGGLRPWLSKYGISLNIAETSEGLGNVTGGAKRGFDYDGLTQGVLQVDTQRAFGLHGGTFNISGLQIHGRNLSADYLDTLQTASGIEADRSTRLWELWYQQKFLDEDRLDIKVGQQSLDQEFMVSQNALAFVNTMFGWPMVPSADLPGGGPAYPLSAPGIRFRARPTDSITVLVGAFNGSPVNNPTGDPQQRNQSGVTFPLDGGLLAIAEVQYSYPSLGSMVYADDSDQLSGTYRLGVWYDTESFADERFGNVTHHGDMGVYGVIDQMLWHSEEDPDHALSVFCRAMGTPQDDRNLIDFSLNVGLTLHDPIPHRDDDTLGIGLGYAKVSGAAANADRDTRATVGAFYPIRTDETFLELTYQYQLFPWCQIQPDFQYVFNPGGGIPNPDTPTERIKDEAVLGVRFNLLF